MKEARYKWISVMATKRKRGLSSPLFAGYGARLWVGELLLFSRYPHELRSVPERFAGGTN
jgi:hypothetical protein